MTGLSIAKSLDLLLLQATVTHDDVVAGCALADEYHLASVCVYPVHVARAVAALRGSDTRVCAAIGHPYGQETTATKLVAIEQARAHGAEEISLMLDHSAIVSGDLDAAVHELELVAADAVRASLHSARGTSDLTLAVETTLYDCTALAPLWDVLHESPVGFVQTSGGHQSRAVTEEHVRQLRGLLPTDVAIKAVGGVHELEAATTLLAAGAVRVGTGSAIAIADAERRGRQVRSTP